MSFIIIMNIIILAVACICVLLIVAIIYQGRVQANLMKTLMSKHAVIHERNVAFKSSVDELIETLKEKS